MAEGSRKTYATPPASHNGQLAEESDQRDAVSNWNKVRLRFIPAEGEPSTNTLSRNEVYGSLSTVKSPIQLRTGLEQSIRPQQPGGQLRGMLKFINTVEQKSDLNRFEKELCRLFNIRDQSDAASLKTASATAVSDDLVSLQELYGTLYKWKHVVKLPLAKLIFRCLGRPFQNPITLYDDCRLALDIFSLIRSHFPPSDAKENLDQVLWAADLLSQSQDDVIQFRVMDIVQEAIPTSEDQEAFPDRADSVFLLTSRLVKGLHVLRFGQARDVDARTFLIDRLRNILNGISDGHLIHLSFSSLQLPLHASSKTYRLCRQITFLEGLFAAMASKNVNLKRTIISEAASAYFVLPDASTIYNFERALDQLSRCIHQSILLDHFRPQTEEIYDISHDLLRLLHRITLEIDKTSLSSAIAHSQASVTMYILIYTNQRLDDPNNRANSALCTQYLGLLRDRGGLQGILSALKSLVASESVEISIHLFERLLRQPDSNLTHSLLDASLDTLFSALLSEMSPKSASITDLLCEMAKSYTVIFFKHVVECLWLEDENLIAHNISIMELLIRYMGAEQYLFYDVEMLVSAATASSANASDVSSEHVSLGQLAIIMEIVRNLQQLRELWRTNNRPLDQNRVEFLRKLETLEFRISIFVNAKEKKLRTPSLTRLLVLQMFREIRRLTRSVRRPPWLGKVTDWILQFDPQDSTALQHQLDCQTFKKRLIKVYSHLNLGPKQSSSFVQESRDKLTTIMDGHYINTAICLLAMLSSTLSDADLKQLLESIWRLFPMDAIVGTYRPLGFLLASISDRIPEGVQGALLSDLYSVYVTRRAFAIERLASFFSIRMEVETQEYLTIDRKLPFRNQVPIIPFVPTDIGSPEDTQIRLKHQVSISDTTVLPIEIRRQLMNLGWDETDPGTLIDVQREILMVRIMPLNHFSGPLLDKGSSELDPMRSKKQKHLRRRAIFIPVLGMGNLGMIDLLNDAHGGLYTLTGECIQYHIREEPSAFLRVFMAELRTKMLDSNESFSRLRLLISKGAVFPPTFTYTVLNDILGFIKWRAREVKGFPVSVLYQSLPLLADLVGMVPDMTLRDIRKNKVDAFLLPGHNLSAEQDVPVDIFDHKIKVACIRISQHLLLKNCINSYPKESTSLRKMLLEIDASSLLTFVNSDAGSAGSTQTHLLTFGPMIYHSWIDVVHVLFQASPRSFNDRIQLSGFLHHIDVMSSRLPHNATFVLQVLRLYIMLGSKFRRLLNTNRGFSLIIPTLFRLYLAIDVSISKLRNACIFVWHQFYTTYGDNFIFQAISSLALLVTKEKGRSAEYSAALFDWLQALNELPKVCQADAVSCSIDAIEVTVDTFDKAPHSRIQESEQSSKIPRHSLADTLRLFFTVIAYDPASLRAEQFVQLITSLLPHLMGIPVVEGIVGDGLIALLRIFAQWSRHIKNSMTVADEQLSTVDLISDIPNVLLSEPAGFQEAYGKHWQQNNKLQIRQEFILLLSIYSDHGGRDLGQSHRQVALIVRQLLRDLGIAKIRSDTAFLGRYIGSCISPKQRSPAETEKQMTYFLSQIAPSVQQCGRTVDFTDMNSAICTFLKAGRGLIGADLINTISDGILSPEIAALCSQHEKDESAAIKFGQSIVDICLALFTNCGVDVVSIFSRQSMSPRFLTYLIVPFCQGLLVTSSISEYSAVSYMDSSRWITLLAWLLSSCQSTLSSLQSRQSLSKSSLGRKTSRKTGRDSDENNLLFGGIRGTVTALTFALNLTAVKLVLIKGEPHFNSSAGLWIDVANVFRGFKRWEYGATQGHAAEVLQFASQRANVFWAYSHLPVGLTVNITPFSSRLPLNLQQERQSAGFHGNPGTSHKIKGWKTSQPLASTEKDLPYLQQSSKSSFADISVDKPTTSPLSQEVPRTIKGLLDTMQSEFNYLCSLTVHLLG